MKYNYKEDIKLKLSNIKHNKKYLDKIKDFEFDITDIFHSVILTEIEHQYYWKEKLNHLIFQSNLFKKKTS